MKCPKCQYENKDTAIFCIKCGTPLKEEANNIAQINKRRRPLDVIFSIVMLIMFSLALIFAWGNMAHVSIRTESVQTFNRTTHIRIGANYFFNIGWRNIVQTQNGYVVALFIVTFILYLVQVILTYFLSVKGIIECIKSFGNGNYEKVDKYGLLFILIFFSYRIIILLGKDAFRALTPDNYINPKITVTTGWGIVMGMIVLWPCLTLYLARKIVKSVEKGMPNKLLSKIFLTISIYITGICMGNFINNPYATNNVSNSIIGEIAYAKTVHSFTNQTALLIVTSILILGTVLGMLSFESLLLAIHSKDKSNNRIALITSSIFSLLVLISIILINATLNNLPTDSETILGSTMVGTFISSIVSLGFVITSNILESKLEN